MALKLVVTKLVCAKLVINFWRSAPAEKSYYKKRPVYAVGGTTLSLKTNTHITNERYTIVTDSSVKRG